MQTSHLSLEDFRRVDLVDRELDTADNGPRWIGNEFFETVSEARATINAVMAEFRGNASDYARDFLLDLVKEYPGYQRLFRPNLPIELEALKNGQLYARQYDPKPRRGFNGTVYYSKLVSRPVSVRECLREGSQRARVVAAARALIQRYNDHRRYLCAICGTVIEPGDLHWDHYPHAFIDIFDEWRAHERLLCSEIELCHSQTTSFESSDLNFKWRLFHDHHAVFRPAHSKCNLTDKVREPFRFDGPLDYEHYREQSGGPIY